MPGLVRRLLMVVLCSASALVIYGATIGQPALDTASAEEKEPAAAPKVGLEKRIPWTTSRLTGQPEPPLPYETERAFPALSFNQPLDLVSPPDSERLYVVEQSGKVFSFPARADVKTADLAIDLAKDVPGAKQVYAIAFHPRFAQNRYCYICLIGDPDKPDGSRISRFTVTDSEPPRIDPDTEQVVITWPSGGHNGCCLKFGPDGYLYISTGDGTGPNPPDTKQTGQDLSDLLSSLLRIDVDHPEAGRNYRIPPDNPFISTAGARPEIWAYGLRNPWRMNFDRKTGDLWLGDVGWELWEMLYRIQRGGNYGWAVTEGPAITNPEWPRGPTPIMPATVEHPHSESSSITGGVSYYGDRLPELVGSHIYGDYDTGKIWAVRWENGKVAWQRELADTTLRIVGFGEDRTGEFYIVDHIGGTLQRLIPNPQPDRSADFPRKLSDTGLFADVAKQLPAAGVIHYSINAQQWQDGASAARYVAIPGDGVIKTAGNATNAAAWLFPADAVLAKTISLNVAPGQDRRLETQVLHFNGIDWRAYTYRWNADQTDASLVDAAGADEPLEIVDPQAPGGKRRQTWHFASRAECLRCHNPWSGSALAFQLPQLNRNHRYEGKATKPTDASQLDTFFHIGLCEPAVPADKRTAVANPHDPNADLSDRARAYLHTNCAHCHRTHAGSSVLSQMQFDLPLEKTMMVGVRPTQGAFGLLAAQVVAPGDPFRSVLLYRMSKLGSGRMPHIGSERVDPDGVALIQKWIGSLPAAENQDSAGSDAVAGLRMRERQVLADLCAADPGRSKQCDSLVDQLCATTSGALLLLRAIEEQELSAPTQQRIVDRAATHAESTVRDLFERFVPEEQRIKRLGSVVRPQEILKLKGDSAQGKKLFFATEGVQCKNCHRIQNTGREVGPDLDQIAKKYGPAQLLETILQPSKSIEPKYVVHVVESKAGRIHSGLLIRKDDAELVLRDVEGKDIRVRMDEVEQIGRQAASLMPELQLRDLTAEQVADLLAYLSSLK